MKKLLSALIALISTCAFAQIGMQEMNVKGLPITMVYATPVKSSTQSFGSFQMEVALNAPPTASRHRLVVLSHGSGGSSYTDHQLAVALAQVGYLVAQPLHSGDNWRDNSQAGPESWKTRPLEISATIDALTKDPAFAPLFDVNKVGIHGMSAGGVSVIAQAGGQWNMLTMAKHCAKNLEADIAFCMSGLVNQAYGQMKRRALFYAANLVPEKYLPQVLKDLHGAAHNVDPRMDKRIQAATLAVPLVAPFNVESLSRINMPIGVVSSADDELLRAPFHSSYLLSHCKSCKSLIELKNASHFDLLSPWPASIAKQVGALQVRGGYPNPHFKADDRAFAFDLIMGFFNQHLK